jgi:hypothetical protein
MCDFFSFVTEPEGHGNERFYFNWTQRKKNFEGADSHDHIIEHYKLKDSACNKFEYNPLTNKFTVDRINNEVNDTVQAEAWVTNLDFKKIVKPLIIKPIIHPFHDIKKVSRPTDEHILLLKKWDSVGDSVWGSVRGSVRDSVGDSVRDSVGNSVWDSVGDSVGNSVWDSVGDSVWGSVRGSVRDSVWGYLSSFFDIKYKHDFTPATQLWEQGLVPSFDGTTWRLHSGEKADIVFEISKDKLQEYK